MSNDNGERIMPTRPGWWWRMWGHDPYIEEVDACDLSVMCIDGDDVVDDGTWLAPIPGPAVCAALAEYGEAVLAADGAPDESSLTSFLARSAADRALRDAIRAERGGAA